MDGADMGSYIAGALIGVLVMAVIGILVGGLLLKWSVRIVQGFSPGYGRSVLVVLATFVVSLVIGMILGVLMGAGSMAAMGGLEGLGSEPDPAAMAALMGTQALLGLVNLIVSLVITALLTNAMIKRPDGASMGFGKALLVALLYTLMLVVLMVIVFFVLAMVIGVGAGLAAA